MGRDTEEETEKREIQRDKTELNTQEERQRRRDRREK